MTESQKFELRASEIREALNTLQEAEELTDDQRSEMDKLTREYRDVETRKRAALVIEADELEAAKAAATASPDRETRERIELRSKARIGGYLRAHLRGRIVDGAEHELLTAAGVPDGSIPIELWDTATPERRDITGAPGTVGLNLDRIRPAVFAPSVIPRLGVEMPRVESGSYASATISTSTTAGARAKEADAPATAAAFTAATSTPKRISTRLSLTLEDIASVGTASFESALRENLSLGLSSELDDQGLNGDGNAPNLAGLFSKIGMATAPGAAVATFDDFVGAFAGGIDGLWASTMKEVAIVAGVESYGLSARTFRDAAGQDLGDMAFADYAMAKYGGWWTNKRMPVKANHIQDAILYRMGRSMMGAAGAMRTAVCPHWGSVSIDDVYSDSGKGIRHFTMHVLLGDVIVVQPDAYKRLQFRVST